MQRSCDICGKTYEAKRKTSKYCPGSTCRTRASRGTAVAPVTVLPDTAAAASVESGTVAAVERELIDAGRLDTWLGQSAMDLARRLAAGQDTASGLAALNRELRTTVAEAVKGAVVATSAVDQRRDELAARRRA